MATELNPPITVPSDQSTSPESTESIVPRIPTGSLEIVYCNECGRLILHGEKVVSKPGDRFERNCEACVAKGSVSKRSMQMIAGLAGRGRKGARKESALGIVPAARGARRGGSAQDAGLRGRRNTPPGSDRPTNSTYTALAVGGCTLLLALGVILFSGSDKTPPSKPKSVKKHNSKKVDFALSSAKSDEVNKVKPKRLRNGRLVDDIRGLSESPSTSKSKIQPKANSTLGESSPKDTDAEKKGLQDTIPVETPANVSPALEKEKAEPAVETPNPFLDKNRVDLAEKNNPEKVAPAVSEEPAVVDDGTGVGIVKPNKSTSSNPFEDKKAGTDSTPGVVRGQAVDLFPKSQRSAIVKSTVKPKSLTRYEGWGWASKNPTGFSVSNGMLQMTSQGSLKLKNFNVKSFDLSFEVRLERNSALGIQYGETEKAINLLVATQRVVLSAAWDPRNKTKSITASKTDGVNQNSGSRWISYRVVVREAKVEVFLGSKRILKFKPPGSTKRARFGFLLFGENNNKRPRLKMRKVVLFAP